MRHTQPSFHHENEHGARVCGIDEAGRGPLAGPVVAACVFVSSESRALKFWRQVNDSKQLPAQKRETLFDLIRIHTVWGIAEASAAEIDALNIHNATLLAMKRAWEAMGFKTDAALIDGKFAPTLSCRAIPLIKGDSKSLSIAAASILAKVTRDRLMKRLHEDHPHYGWDRNAGYPAPAHLEALRRHGLTPHHRRSYAPCAAIAA